MAGLRGDLKSWKLKEDIDKRISSNLLGLSLSLTFPVLSSLLVSSSSADPTLNSKYNWGLFFAHLVEERKGTNLAVFACDMPGASLYTLPHLPCEKNDEETAHLRVK